MTRGDGGWIIFVIGTRRPLGLLARHEPTVWCIILEKEEQPTFISIQNIACSLKVSCCFLLGDKINSAMRGCACTSWWTCGCNATTKSSILAPQAMPPPYLTMVPQMEQHEARRHRALVYCGHHHVALFLWLSRIK